MGIGGKFWDLLKPYACHENPDFLLNKRVAVDLSYWILQHETAITNSYVRKPHLRLTFYRTINLFTKFGAFPVFVLDGTPSPLKSRARIQRFFRCSSLGFSDDNNGASVERNRAFLKSVKECVELLELLGMPIVKATGEAEALCAQLNREGFVDACITADSDAFLYGANCVIKNLKPNSKEPFECYNMSDIEAGLGLKRKHLIVISLLVGNDHDLNGVQGIGLENALRLVRSFNEDEILDRLCEIGNGNASLFQASSEVVNNVILSPDGSSPKSKASHCSFCGHPGSKREHFKSSCEYCGNSSSDTCTKMPEGFKCSCSSCDKVREEKEKQKLKNWQIKICDKIASEPNFPNANIIDMYLRNDHRDYASSNRNDLNLSWETPNIDMLVDLLVFHKLWEPSYVRQRMIPVLSTIYLREMAKNPEKSMLYGQYEFDSIKRIRTRYGHQSYVVKWKKAACTIAKVVPTTPVEEFNFPEIIDIDEEEEIIDVDEAVDESGESNVSQIQVDDGHGFLLTDENMELVSAAFPDEVDRFVREKELKELKRRKASSVGSEGKAKGTQLNITEFYRSTKLQIQANQGDICNSSEKENEEKSKEKRKVSNSNLPKSARRRLLFN